MNSLPTQSTGPEQRNMWSQLWDREVLVDELKHGQLVAFIKASVRDGSYGIADALIAALDATPLTHIGIVDCSSSEPRLIHSFTTGLLHEPLIQAADKHRHSPAFVFEHSWASAETQEALVESASAKASAQVPPKYPFTDLIPVATMLRLRADGRYDEHDHRWLTGFIADLFASSDGGGRMCAAFIAQCFAEIGVPIEPPEEAQAFREGLATRTGWTQDGRLLPPDVVNLLEIAMPDFADGALGIVNMAQMATTDDDARTQQLEALTGLLHQLRSGGGAARWFVEWLTAPVPDDTHGPEARAALRNIAGTHLRNVPEQPARFFTVSDLVRSTSIQPVGHLRHWYDQNKSKEGSA